MNQEPNEFHDGFTIKYVVITALHTHTYMYIRLTFYVRNDRKFTSLPINVKDFQT